MDTTNGTAHKENGAPPVAPSITEKAKVAPAQRGQVIPDLATWAYASRIGGGITPARISSIIREADAGEVRRLIDLANECRQRDSHLQAVLSVGEESIAGLPWQIVPASPSGGKEPRRKDKKVAAWVDEILRGIPGLQTLIANLAGAIYYSHAVNEIIWTKDGGKLVPDHFLQVAPRRFRYRRTDGALVFHDEGQPEVDLSEAYPNKFITSRPRVTGDIPQREGLCRVLVWMSTMRNWSIGDWLKTGEMSWKPWRIGTYKKTGSSPEDRDDLEDIMRRMTTDFSAVIPDSCEIEVNWPGGTASTKSTHGEICNVLAQEISKAVLGQTETTQASVSSGYAQAKVHDAVRRDLREARAKQVAADLTRDLIGPMIRMNFGASVEIPRFEFLTQDPVDLKAFSEAVKNLRDAGARIPESWLYEQAGIPEPKERERVLGEGTEQDDQAPNDQKQPSDSDEDGGEEDTGKEPGPDTAEED